tara:strand:+ start:388 stop:585 length:198 start_codon:yes stop_codon:yes gene_type:complete
MIELILLSILVVIGIVWFRNLSENSNTEEDPEVEALRKQQKNNWGTYISILVVSGFFIWLLLTTR